jgi:hypothetical protein
MSDMIWDIRLDDIHLISQKYLFLTFPSINIIISMLLLLLLVSNSLFHKAFAASPAFDQVFFEDKEKFHWVQTHGNSDANLKSGYADILAVDYASDGKTLDTRLWLASNSENASTYSQPLKHIRYGMLIAIVSLPENSGYNGANYDFYIESVNGKWNQYLYQLSSTGTRALIYSKTNYTESFGGPTIGPGYVKLRLDLAYIHSPRSYGLSFYTAESFKSNEVRDFTSWVAIPPATITTLTKPRDIVIRQGEAQLIPAQIETPLSNNVTSIKFVDSTNYTSSGLSVSTESIQPALFKVMVSPQTRIGVYTIPFVASLFVQTTSSKLATFNHTVTGFVDPEFQISKKYPTTGYITGKANLTISVIAPLSLSENFTAFWDKYGTPIVTSGVAAVSFTYVIDIVKRRKEHK